MSNDYNFTFIWELWLDIWELFTSLLRIFDTDIFYIVERIIEEWFNITVDIPFSFTIIDVVSTPLMVTIIILGVAGFIFRIVKDIVNPFN